MKKPFLPQAMTMTILLLCSLGCEEESDRVYYKKSSFVVNDTRIKAKDVSVSEGARSVSIPYQWQNLNQGQSVSFRWYTENGSAQSGLGRDYTHSSGTQDTDSNGRNGVVNIPILDDSSNEGNEYFRVVFIPLNESRKSIFDQATIVTVTIQDNELATETFVQSVTTIPIDILWVIDNSGSMKGNQTNLANNFSSFINNFSSLEVDFNMAIITTDNPSNQVSAQFPLNRQSLASNRTAFIEEFQKKIKVGTGGSTNEKGLQKSHYFLEQNPSWARHNAYLSIIYVSDEEDHSGSSVQSWITSLQLPKAHDTELLKIYSIVNKTTGNDQGKRYIEAAQATGGISADIEGDFTSTLQDLSQHINQLSASFRLAQTPASNTISVSVDGVTVNASDWFINGRTLAFNEDAIPADGAVIVVNYQRL